MASGPAGPVPVVVMGLGFIGQEIAKAALASPELKLIGAVDANHQLVGKKLSDILGEGGSSIKVTDDLVSAIGKSKRPVVLHATGSRLPQVVDQLLEAARAGACVASTCEELAFPYLKHPELAEKL